MAKKNRRFDLFTMLEWTAALAFFSALLAGSGTSAQWTWDFGTVPADDSGLIAWLESQKIHDVEVSRAGNSVTLESKYGILTSFTRAFGVPNPPWQELGYAPLTGQRGKTEWKMFSGPKYLWLSGFTMLLMLALIRRYFIQPISETKSAA